MSATVPRRDGIVVGAIYTLTFRIYPTKLSHIKVHELSALVVFLRANFLGFELAERRHLIVGTRDYKSKRKSNYFSVTNAHVQRVELKQLRKLRKSSCTGNVEAC